MSKVLNKHNRRTAKRKFDAVIELLKNHKKLDELSRETDQPTHVLSQWRDDFINHGEVLFKEPESPRERSLLKESNRLKTKIGEQVMEIEYMSQTYSISVKQRFGLLRVSRVWCIPHNILRKGQHKNAKNM